MPKGRGTAEITDMKIVGSTTYVKLRKDGCKDQQFSITKSEQLNVGALIGGIFFLVPFLWIMEYQPERYYDFACEAK
jgi:hypothetical protein